METSFRRHWAVILGITSALFLLAPRKAKAETVEDISLLTCALTLTAVGMGTYVVWDFVAESRWRKIVKGVNHDPLRAARFINERIEESGGLSLCSSKHRRACLLVAGLYDKFKNDPTFRLTVDPLAKSLREDVKEFEPDLVDRLMAYRYGKIGELERRVARIRGSDAYFVRKTLRD